jgi:hypothetical protein
MNNTKTENYFIKVEKFFKKFIALLAQKKEGFDEKENFITLKNDITTLSVICRFINFFTNHRGLSKKKIGIYLKFC